MKSILEPKFENDTFTDLIFDQDGKGHAAKISYEGVNYDHAFRIYHCEVSTDYRYVSQVDIEELLHLREGKRISFECSLNVLPL